MANYIYYDPTLLDYKDFNPTIKNTVHQRDNFQCQVCYKTGSLLVTHHIDYDKEDSHPMNLITLCRGCHKKTYNHKGDWLRLFTEKMHYRFGSQYTAYLNAKKTSKKYHIKINISKHGPVRIINPGSNPPYKNKKKPPTK